MNPLWLPDIPVPDQHAAFRATFTLPAASAITVRLLGASWFVAWIDGERFAEGPARFPVSHPEWQEHRLRLPAGKHVLAIHATHFGVANRILLAIPPFVAGEVRSSGDVPLAWKCFRLDGHARAVRRVNAQLGWMEWWDLRGVPEHWTDLEFDDSPWPTPVAANPGLGAPQRLAIAPVGSTPLPLRPIATGNFLETFGYEHDDAPARFFLRDLKPADTPPQGVWRRYDLGRVRLGRPSFVLDAPPGTAVEFAVSESLNQGRVSPWITLSASSSANFWHVVSRGGKQRIEPLVPLGGRYLEAHVLGDPEQIRWVEETWLDRGYYGPPEGSLSTGDKLLDKIWVAGIETFRACAEDAIIDNPTRERGAWTGDAVAAGLDIAGVGWSDTRLAARSLRQAAWTARADGLIPGMAVGDPIFIPSYAAAWVEGVLRQVELTGDFTLLRELLEPARQNIGAFLPKVGGNGLEDGLGWSFIDWGYARPEGPVDPALNIHFLGALRAFRHWCALLDKPEMGADAVVAERTVEQAMRRWIDDRRAGDRTLDPSKIGYHTLVLGLRAGLFDSNPDDIRRAVDAIKAHWRNCFPNQPSAPRLSDPSVSNSRLITPYFAHYAFPTLIERGEMDFVREQIRGCWGWMLSTGATTILEVFDTRWSHCHQWSACPTWQLSRYLLGLRPRFDRGPLHYQFVLQPGSSPSASGVLPVAGSDERLRIAWKRLPAGQIEWVCDGPSGVRVDFGDGVSLTLANRTRVVLERRTGRWVPA